MGNYCTKVPGGVVLSWVPKISYVHLRNINCSSVSRIWAHQPVKGIALRSIALMSWSKVAAPGTPHREGAWCGDLVRAVLRQKLLYFPMWGLLTNFIHLYTMWWACMRGARLAKLREQEEAEERRRETQAQHEQRMKRQESERPSPHWQGERVSKAWESVRLHEHWEVPLRNNHKPLTWAILTLLCPRLDHESHRHWRDNSFGHATCQAAPKTGQTPGRGIPSECPGRGTETSHWL